MRIPKSIKPGDTIGLVAPSFGAAIEPYITRLEAAIRTFEKRGYQVVAADSCYKSDGLGISTSPASAARDVCDFYLDASIDALISVGGGELMNETISCIDFERLKAAPAKWFMGYSDNTNMIVPMAALSDVAGIYAPCASGFGKPWEDTENDAFALLEGTKNVITGYPYFEHPDVGDAIRKSQPLARYQLTEEKVLTSFVSDGTALVKAGDADDIEMSGTLMGGCLDVLVNLSGTEYDGIHQFNKSHKKVIWILEACDLNPMAIRRSVWSLLHQGWFENAAGFLIGRPMAAFRQTMMGVDTYNAVTDIVAELGVPVIMDADIGHVSPMMPLVIGADANVCVRGNHIEIRMNL